MIDSRSTISEKDSRDARLLIIRQSITIPVQFLKSISVLPLLSPDQVFILRLITTWMNYTLRADMGTFTLFALYFPAAEAQGNHQLGEQYKYQAWSFAMFSTLVAAGVGVFIAIRFLPLWHIPVLFVWGIGIVSVRYISSYYQATGNFNGIAIIDIVHLISSFFLSFSGLLFFGFDGYLIGSVIPAAMVLWLGRECLFPPPTHLPRSFVRHSMLDGGHLALGGFLSTFIKTHEITFFAIFGLVNVQFAGQYAVAIALASMQDGLITSVSTVYQRRVTKDFVSAHPEDRNSLIFDFALLDLILCSITSAAFLLGSLLFPYILPNYSEVAAIMPMLIMATAIQRGRFYPGHVFRLDKQFRVNISGHLVNLTVGVATFFAMIWLLGPDSPLIAVNQVIGSLAGSLFHWTAYFRIKDSRYWQKYSFHACILTTMLLLSAGAYIILLPTPLLSALTVLLGNISLVIYSRLFLKNAFGMLKKTIHVS